MSIRIREQFICCIFAVILFLTGMCVEVPPADVSFLCAEETTSAGFCGSVLRERASYEMLEQVCALETLRRGNATILGSNKGRSPIRRFARTVVILLAVAILLSYLFYQRGIGEIAFAEIRSSHTAIVRYIQQTDGKK